MQNHAASPVCDLAVEVRVGLTIVVLNDLGELRNRIRIIPGKSDWIHVIYPLAAIVFVVVFIVAQSKEGSRVFIPVGEVCEGLSDDI
jgi:hypothetical protein